MRVDLRLGGLISLNGREIALGQTFTLLNGIAQERSVRGAAERLGVSYRSAWGRMLALEEAVGRPVVVKTKGHGSVLTELGAELRDALGATLHRFEASLADEQRALERRLAVLVDAPPSKLRVAASHDPLLTSILAELPNVAVTVIGSSEAVERLRAGDADVAGLHFGAVGPARQGEFAALFRDPAFEVRPLFVRQQGLMVAPGNPLSIAAIRDIAARKARFVNRQRGSGTRLWFDQLLAEAGVQAESIVGYEVEEFTHQAVAAVIASGAADVGMGVRAVAERFGLTFVPIGAETYFMAIRVGFQHPLIDQLFRTAGSRSTQAAGYGPVGSVATAPEQDHDEIGAG